MLLTILLILLTNLILIIRIRYNRNFSYWSRYKQIPSVTGKIFSGNLKDFLTFKTNFNYHLKTIYDDPKFQNEAAVGIYGLYKPALLLRDPELIKSVFIKDFDCFANRSAVIDPHHDPIGGLSLFFARYSYWREIRTKLSPVFSSGKMKYMYPLIQQVGNNLEKYLEKKGANFVMETKEICGRFTTDLISTTIMGFNSNALENLEEPIYKETFKSVDFHWRRALDVMVIFFMCQYSRILGSKFFPNSTERFIRSSITFVMSERERSGEKRNDLIDLFVKIKQDVKTNGGNVTQCMEGLIAQGCILMAGGYETSSTTLATTLLELAKHQDVQKRLREEILQAFLEESGEISYERINKMQYLQMVVDEVLRIYPVFPLLDRRFEKPENKTTSSYSLKPYYDYDLPIGMPVYVSPYSLHYDSKYWPNPTKFDPERFSPENKPLINPMVYLPFGGGPRNCIGMRMGLLEVKIGLVHFLKNHSMQICDKTVVQPEFDPKGFVLQIKGGVYLEVVRDNLYENAAGLKC